MTDICQCSEDVREVSWVNNLAGESVYTCVVCKGFVARVGPVGYDHDSKAKETKRPGDFTKQVDEWDGT